MKPAMTSLALTPPTVVKEIFDRRLVRMRRDRAAEHFENFAFLLERCEEEFADRLGSYLAGRQAGNVGAAADESAGRVLCLGAHKGSVGRILRDVSTFAPSLVVECDLSAKMLGGMLGGTDTAFNVIGSDELLPFAPASFDIILAPVTLQFANDLPGALAQIRRCLKPGGLLLCAIFGGETLHELRGAFAQAEIDIEGGLSPRVIPFADIKDFGGLLQRVGFSEPVCDVDKVSVTYSKVTGLMRDLRGMGLTNPMRERRRTFLRRKTLAALERTYRDQFGIEGRDQFGIEGQIEASFHIIFGTGRVAED